jgi:hypothetical protein
MMPFWWAWLTAELQAAAGAELLPVAKFGDGDPLYQFHGKVGSPARGGPGVENRRYVGVVHHGECLAFGLDHLERHHASQGVVLLRQPHDTEPSLAELLEELVAPDHRPLSLRRHPANGLTVTVRPITATQSSSVLLVFADQCLEGLPHSGVLSAGRSKIGGPHFGQLKLDSRNEYRLLSRIVRGFSGHSRSECRVSGSVRK